jgi:hypothetical protein
MKVPIFVLPLAVLLLDFGPPAISEELTETSAVIPVTIGQNTIRLDALFVKKADARDRLPVAIITNGGTLTATAGLAVSGTESMTDMAWPPRARLGRDRTRAVWLQAREADKSD